MAPQNDTLRERLGRYSEIKISVTSRKTGRTISNPIWFVFEGNSLFLPIQGAGMGHRAAPARQVRFVNQEAMR